MNRFFLALLALAVPFVCSAQDRSLDLFRYNPAKMDAKVMYTYKVHNQAGDKSILMYVYGDDNKFAVLKDYSTVVPEVFFIRHIELDKRYYAWVNGYAENPFRYLKTPQTNNTSSGEWDFAKKRYKGGFTIFDAQGRVENKDFVVAVQRYPTTDLSLYSLDLIYALRGYVGDKKPFPIGATYGGYYLDATVSYVGTETANGVLCDKWRVEGQGALSFLFGVKQEIWLAKDDPTYYLVKYKNYMGIIMPFGDVAMDFVSKQTMSPEEWNQFSAAQVEQARVRLGFPKDQSK